MEFGVNLRRLRETAGMSQSDLADKVGVTRGMIAQYELGAKSPTVATACRIADVFGCTLDSIAGNAKAGDNDG